MRTVAELSSLDGRTAFLTGGAGHIGLAAAEVLIELGATVALVDQDLATCEKRASDFCSVRPKSCLAFGCDLQDADATREAVLEAIQGLGGLDILIHCAAYVNTATVSGWTVPFGDQTVEAWQKGLDINLTSAFVLTQAAAPALSTSGLGSVIFFGSIYGLVGPDLRVYEGTNMASPAAYGASKGGLVQLMRYLATVLAPQVRVNAISPGGVWRQQPEEFREQYERRTPLGRMAVEEDLKGAVAFLASDLSAYVTGQNVVVDGGWTSW